MQTLPAATISVGVSFTAVIGFGFWIHQKTDSIPDDVFGTAAGIAIPVIGCALFMALTGIRPNVHFRIRPRKRGAPLPALPQRTPEEQIAYRMDKNAVATCVHLQQVERAMRVAGIEVELRRDYMYWPVIEANCRINEPAMRKAFALPEFIVYLEGYQPERSPYDNPWGSIRCDECFETNRPQCEIQVLHPDECTAETPWFPTPSTSASPGRHPR